MGPIHTYELTVTWTGDEGRGTADYRSYRRDHVVSAEGRPDLAGSSDPTFRGDATRWNPEQLLVAALSQCHMLWYLHLCATNDVVVTGYSFVSKSLPGAGVYSSGIPVEEAHTWRRLVGRFKRLDRSAAERTASRSTQDE